MQTPAARTTRSPDIIRPGEVENTSSGVSWAAITAGGVASASLALILLALGVGLGLSSVSPWSNTSVSATTIGLGVIVWLIFTHVVASGMGGYLAGRLRAKWVGVHTEEVYFRDTAHGFLAWALAAVLAAALLGSATSAILSAGANAAGKAASTIATTAAAAGLSQSPGDSGDPMGYFTDSLLRPEHPPTQGSDASGRTEVGRILSTSLQRGTLDPADKTYLAKLISARTGIAELDAEKRIDATITRAKAETAKAEATAKQAGDAARRAAAHSALWMFVALLCGAFAASYAATWGGRRRDNFHVAAPSQNAMLAPQ